MPELIHELLPRLRGDMSLSSLSRRTVREGFAGLPETTIKAIEKNPGRVPEAWILRALADALGVAPERFYEWPIAVAREGARGTAATTDVPTAGGPVAGDPDASAIADAARHVQADPRPRRSGRRPRRNPPSTG